MRLLFILPLACSLSCTKPPEGAAPPDTAPPSTATTVHTGTPTLPSTPSDTAPAPSTPPWELLDVDCTALEPLPLAYEVLDWIHPAEDYSFDDDGYLVSVSGGNLERTPYGGPPEILVPNLGDVRGTRFLLDDTLALATIDSQVVLNVDPDDGSRTVIASGLVNPNGIAIGVDGWVYVTVSEQVVRFDPAVGQIEVIVDMPGKSFDGITFSPDFSRLYFNEEVGRVHWVDIAPDGSVGPPFDGPLIPIGAFSILDGMAVDACGNLYVTEMGGIVWRVSVDGAVEVVVDLDEALAFIPALNFGTGLGGWDAETLYVSDFKGKLYALDAGVPGKWEPHLPVPAAR